MGCLLALVLLSGCAKQESGQPPGLAPAAGSVTSVTTDLLMSDDMALYLANEGKGLVLGEEDME